MYKVISTGSQGNAVLYNNQILVDCGVPFALIKPYLYNIQLILLTHSHKDHININTLKRIAFERPSVRIGVGKWMSKLVEGIRNVDYYNIGSLYNYGSFLISPVKLYHDVPNCGYRIYICNGKGGEYKIFHATDTAHLNGISAKEYDLYAIEHSYDEDTVQDTIKDKQARGEYAYEVGAINSHLSEQQARAFIFDNQGSNSAVLRLHEHSLIESSVASGN